MVAISNHPEDLSKINASISRTLPNEPDATYTISEILLAYTRSPRRLFTSSRARKFSFIAVGPQEYRKSSPTTTHTDTFLQLLSSPCSTLPDLITHLSLSEQRKSVAHAQSKWLATAVPVLARTTFTHLHTLEMHSWDFRTLSRAAIVALTPVWERLTTLVVDDGVYFETFFLLTDVLTRCVNLRELHVGDGTAWVDGWYPDVYKPGVEVPLPRLEGLSLSGRWEKYTFFEWFCAFDGRRTNPPRRLEVKEVAEDDVIPIVTYLHMYGDALEKLTLGFTMSDVNAQDEFTELTDLSLLTHLVSLSIQDLHTGAIIPLISTTIPRLASPSLESIDLRFADDPSSLQYVLEHVVEWDTLDQSLGGTTTKQDNTPVEKGKGTSPTEPTMEGTTQRFPNLSKIIITYLSPNAYTGVTYAAPIDNPPLAQRLPLCNARNVLCGPLPNDAPVYVLEREGDSGARVEGGEEEEKEEFDESGLPRYRGTVEGVSFV